MQTYDEILEKHAQAAEAEIKAEAAKSEAQKRLEAATLARDTYGAEYVQLAKNASQHQPRMKELERLMREQDETASKANSELYLESQQQAEIEQAAQRAQQSEIFDKHIGQGSAITPRPSYTATNSGINIPQR